MEDPTERANLCCEYQLPAMDRERNGDEHQADGDMEYASNGTYGSMAEDTTNVEKARLNGTQQKEEESSFWKVFKDNRDFRLYLLSYITNKLGEWLTYLASISAIEEIQLAQGSNTTSKMAISILMVIRLAPNVILAPFGGVLADGRDRRESMIALDMTGALIAWLFVVAVECHSVLLVYLATFLQECQSGLYEPSRSSIIPLLVRNENDLKKATTLAGVAWSVMAAVGSATGGFLVALLGIRACFLVDSLTYLGSAILMFCVRGKFDVSSGESYQSPWSQVKGMTIDGVRYLYGSLFGALVFLKASGAIVYGGMVILNVSFADRGSLQGRPIRLAILFSAVGLGCLIGPLIVDMFTDMGDPKTLQRACLYAFALMAIGCTLMGTFSPFELTCLFTAIRAMGSSIVWINSSLLLQKFSSPEMLGRVTAMDYSLALSTEAISVYVVGVLQDDANMSAEQVSLLLGAIALVCLLFWSLYHHRGGGAVCSKA